MRKVGNHCDTRWHVTIDRERSDGTALRWGGNAFQLGCDLIRQPLPVAGGPLRENASSYGGPIQIPPRRRRIGDIQFFGKAMIVAADLAHDFMPPVPSFGGN
ncbi:hypothetical protein SAMN05216304_110131 [Bosea sp. OK403]|nr:hypothetical protein SAMN05216304_110131 [Bosea sp. OK403]